MPITQISWRNVAYWTSSRACYHATGAVSNFTLNLNSAGGWACKGNFWSTCLSSWDVRKACVRLHVASCSLISWHLLWGTHWSPQKAFKSCNFALTELKGSAWKIFHPEPDMTKNGHTSLPVPSLVAHGWHHDLPCQYARCAVGVWNMCFHSWLF